MCKLTRTFTAHSLHQPAGFSMTRVSLASHMSIQFMFSFHFHDALSFNLFDQKQQCERRRLPFRRCRGPQCCCTGCRDLPAEVWRTHVRFRQSEKIFEKPQAKQICAYNATFDVSAEEEVSVNVLSLIESENLKYQVCYKRLLRICLLV